MDDCNAVSIPVDVNQKLSKVMEEEEGNPNAESERFPYREAIGSLLFLSMITRPDISFAVNLLSRFCEKPQMIHWRAVKRVIRYVKGTANIKLVYGQSHERLMCYSDADWAASLDDRKSTTGYVLTMFGGAVSWRTKRQPTVALSTTEAEYMAIVACIQEGIWINSLLEEIGIYYNNDEKRTLNLFADNKGAIQFAQNNSYSERTKHVDIKLKFIKEKIDREEVQISYLPSDEMPADILTKACTNQKLQKHVPTFGLKKETKRNEQDEKKKRE